MRISVLVCSLPWPLMGQNSIDFEILKGLRFSFGFLRDLTNNSLGEVWVSGIGVP